MGRKNYILFVFFLIIPFGAFGQQEDFRTWINVELQGELFNLIDFSITPEVRLWDNSTRFDGILGEVDLSVPVTKFFRPGFYYRYEFDRDRRDNYNNTNRFGIYAKLDERIGGLRMAYRAMYQREYTNLYTEKSGWIPVSVHRHKITLKYRQKGWDITPLVSVEGFFTLNPIKNANQEKIRLTAGVRYRLTKKIDLGIDYKYQQEFYENNPLTSHIFSIGAKFEL